MLKPYKCIVTVLLGSLLYAKPVFAQKAVADTPTNERIMTGRGAAPTDLPAPQVADIKPVEISVSYQFSVPIKSAEPMAQVEAAEQGRRMVYDIIGKECRLLEATLASSCNVERANVQASTQRGSAEGLSINGSASFKILLKPRS
jgi:hypothetical protein